MSRRGRKLPPRQCLGCRKLLKGAPAHVLFCRTCRLSDPRLSDLRPPTSDLARPAQPRDEKEEA
jgi:hypothetical protein